MQNLHSFNQMQWSKGIRGIQHFDTAIPNQIRSNNNSLIFPLVQGSMTFQTTVSQIDSNVFRIFIEPSTSSYYRIEQPNQPEKLLHLDSPISETFSQNGFAFSIKSNPFSIQFKQDSSSSSLTIEKITSSLNSWTVTFEDNDIGLIGLPERHSPLFLAPSISGNQIKSDPYRLFNIDTGRYVPPAQYSTYGTIPFLSSSSSAIYLANASDTFADIMELNESTEKPTNCKNKKVSVHFISEFPPIDIFIFFGDRPKTTKLFKDLVGHTFLPQPGDFGFQHCKWGIATQNDAEEVVRTYEGAKIPFDVLWLDIDHLFESRPLTVATDRFPSLSSLSDSLHSKGRRLARIVDPHIPERSKINALIQFTGNSQFPKKTHENLNQEGNAISRRNYQETPKIPASLCMQQNGQVFVGDCWPGKSVYPDFLDENARKWWSDRIKEEKIDIVWNDMNEPSVFNSEEKTFPRGVKHINGLDHFACHNVYGHMMSYATFSAEQKLVLTRSFFAGSQKHTAIWTGDNPTSWESLRESVDMLLTLSICGISYSGVDIGGFLDNPSDELLRRWFEVGVWIYPFLRCHGHLQTPPRHYRIASSGRIKAALNERYSFIPYWQASFTNDHITALPVLRPVFYDFPNTLNRYRNSDSVLVGESILVWIGGATKENHDPKKEQIDLPKESGWVDLRTGFFYSNFPGLRVPEQNQHVRIFAKEGSIIPMFAEVKESVQKSKEGGIHLFIALNEEGEAKGKICDPNDHSKLLEIEWKDGEIICESNEIVDSIRKETICSKGSEPIFLQL